jgi:hypothetical protein
MDASLDNNSSAAYGKAHRLDKTSFGKRIGKRIGSDEVYYGDPQVRIGRGVDGTICIQQISQLFDLRRSDLPSNKAVSIWLARRHACKILIFVDLRYTSSNGPWPFLSTSALEPISSGPSKLRVKMLRTSLSAPLSALEVRFSNQL